VGQGGLATPVRSVVAATAASTVLAIAATVMTLPLTLAAIASGTRQSRGGMGVIGVECLWGGVGLSRLSVSSSKTRPSQTLLKDENSVLCVMMAQR
jgi:hypothetical protein